MPHRDKTGESQPPAGDSTGSSGPAAGGASGAGGGGTGPAITVTVPATKIVAGVTKAIVPMLGAGMAVGILGGIVTIYIATNFAVGMAADEHLSQTSTSIASLSASAESISGSLEVMRDRSDALSETTEAIRDSIEAIEATAATLTDTTNSIVAANARKDTELALLRQLIQNVQDSAARSDANLQGQVDALREPGTPPSSRTSGTPFDVVVETILTEGPDWGDDIEGRLVADLEALKPNARGEYVDLHRVVPGPDIPTYRLNDITRGSGSGLLGAYEITWGADGQNRARISYYSYQRPTDGPMVIRLYDDVECETVRLPLAENSLICVCNGSPDEVFELAIFLDEQ